MEDKRPNQCVVDGCERARYEEHDKCILHCEKSTHFSNTDFFEHSITKLLKSYAVSSSPDGTIIFRQVIFPVLSHKFYQHLDEFLYIYFYGCVFSNFHFSNTNQAHFEFYNCVFTAPCTFFLDNNIDVLFLHCKFKSHLQVIGSKEPYAISTPICNDCEFNHSLSLINLNCSNDFTDNGVFRDINSLDIIRCRMEKPTKIENIADISIEYSLFINSLFICLSANLSTYISSTTIEKSFTCTSSTFNEPKIFISHSIFNGIADFSDMNIMSFPAFESIIFNSFVSFKSAKFLGGFNLDLCNFKSSVNFYNLEVNFTALSKETCRIIKKSFDDIGNTTDANKYFALEMGKLYSELSWKNNFSEKLLLSINKYTSNFGQNWWLPIIWMVGLASLFYALREYDPFDYPFLNGIASFIIPYQGIIGTSHQMSKLLTSILFGVLIYQTTVALKRKTRR